MSEERTPLPSKNGVLVALQRTIGELNPLLEKIDEVYDNAEKTREAYRQFRANMIEAGVEGKNQEQRDAKIDIALEQQRIDCHFAETAVKKFEKRAEILLAKQRGIETLLNHLK